MLPPSSAVFLAASLLAALPVQADGLYTKKSPVLQVTSKNYDQLIAHSNHTSIVEFYAPWCGHCQNLKPAYEKAAKNLDGLAKVAAINCDEDTNKPLCGQMGVRGFPTLKIVTPGKKPGKPRVEDYQGARSAKAIVEAVVDRIPNHVRRLTDKDLDSWLSDDHKAPKAILFTDKGTTSALIRALAIDFLGSIQIAQVRNKETAAVERFGVKEFPTLVLIPAGSSEQDAIVYSGDLKKAPLVEFLSQVAAPNPDPAPVAPSAAKKSSSSKAPAAEKKKKNGEEEEDDDDGKTQQADESGAEEQQQQPPAPAPPVPAPQIESLTTPEALAAACLAPKSGTCVLALLPEESQAETETESSAQVVALASLAEVAHKHALHKSKLFPLYGVPATNSGAKSLRVALGLSEQGLEIVAVNGRRGWWRKYASAEADYSVERLDAWVDAIRLGEGSKEKLPEGVIVAESQQAEKPVVADHDEL
ncbi:putative disulfide isomerase [Aspergillus saccharolyticus JOP 1030-1]|uniref:protein disulfide-isomerase n=1 Tax=Aspergillus saccharolyticus JOP 1030-1 TaxID=1450539 RepID=A0A318ZR92_9EURO|nr:thioredoxin-domain-containing protein [Aspergillus saccharolyticus JOP 1030-1]PYH50046.1 thioredoxin-domain-containing protein [Aspergillus saccharolyticus JOP 1030-1]